MDVKMENIPNSNEELYREYKISRKIWKIKMP